jgi:hypothetical protein
MTRRRLQIGEELGDGGSERGTSTVDGKVGRPPLQRRFLPSPANSGELFLISGTNVSTGIDVAAYDHTVMALLNVTA